MKRDTKGPKIEVGRDRFEIFQQGANVPFYLLFHVFWATVILDLPFIANFTDFLVLRLNEYQVIRVIVEYVQ